MDERAYRKLVGLVRQRAGDSFRTAFAYDPDGYTTLYVRDDVATAALEESVETLLAQARGHEPIIEPETYDKLGEVRASVDVHEHGVVIHLRQGPESGVVISLDETAAQSLAGFVEECSRILPTTAE